MNLCEAIEVERRMLSTYICDSATHGSRGLQVKLLGG